MDNHLHLLLRIDPDLAKGWSDTEVAERWFMLFPPRGADRKPMKVSEEIMAARLANPVWIAETRICKRRSLEVWQLSESAVGWRMSCGCCGNWLAS